MTWTDLQTVLPLLVLAITPVAGAAGIAIRRNHLATLVITTVGLTAAFGLLFESESTGSPQVTALVVMDHYGLFYMGLIIIASGAVALFAYPYLQKRGKHSEEFYLLLALATLGATALAVADHFASFLLGLEILSISLYGLISYPQLSARAIEASTKYLVLAAFSAAFLFFGMALVYAQLGTMQFSEIAGGWQSSGNTGGTLAVLGLAIMIVGIGFKLALVPFHLWTPDIFEGASAPAAGFIATVSKGAMFALMLRFFSEIRFEQSQSLYWIFYSIAIASMVVGNVLALFQNNLKRLLAYSSISHLGYLLVAFMAAGSLAVTAVNFYFVTYFATTLAAFGVIAVMSEPARDADVIEDYRGLAWTHPGLALVMTVSFLSLAGIPLTAGFIGKFYLITAGAGASLWALVVVLTFTSALGLFYYLRVINIMFSTSDAAPVSRMAFRLPTPDAGNVTLAAILGVVVWLGVYPSPLIHLVQNIGLR